MSEIYGERPVVVTFDARYVRPVAAVLRSLARVRAGQPTTVIGLVGGVLPEDLVGLFTLAQTLGLTFEVRETPRVMPGLPYDSHGSPAAYYRLMVDQMLPEYSSVLYVDSDTIFLRDPAELLALRFDPYPIAAVQDLCVPTLSSPDCLPGYEIAEAERDVPYFNSGLLIIDLVRWRELDVGGAAMRFAVESPQHVRFWDQDALNAVIRGNWHQLDRRWNVFPLHEIWSIDPFAYYGEEQVSRDRLSELAREAFLVHYVTRHKPWTDGFPPGRLRDLWLAHDEEINSCRPRGDASYSGDECVAGQQVRLRTGRPPGAGVSGGEWCSAARAPPFRAGITMARRNVVGRHARRMADLVQTFLERWRPGKDHHNRHPDLQKGHLLAASQQPVDADTRHEQRPTTQDDQPVAVLRAGYSPGPNSLTADTVHADRDEEQKSQHRVESHGNHDAGPPPPYRRRFGHCLAMVHAFSIGDGLHSA